MPEISSQSFIFVEIDAVRHGGLWPQLNLPSFLLDLRVQSPQKNLKQLEKIEL
jgi:hypothetical protein